MVVVYHPGVVFICFGLIPRVKSVCLHSVNVVNLLLVAVIHNFVYADYLYSNKAY